jgi:hypothetical protein
LAFLERHRRSIPVPSVASRPDVLDLRHSRIAEKGEAVSTARFRTKSGTTIEREQPPSTLSRRQIWYALGITFSVVATVISLAITNNPLRLLQFRAQPDRPTEAASRENQRVGRIILEIDPDQCRQLKFDNVTGQISGTSTPCESAFDSHGEPVPLGTLHRLNAISQSFAHGGN